MTNQLDDQELFDSLFSQLSVHESNCDKHVSCFNEAMTTRLWKDLIMLLEDGQQNDWEKTSEALLAVPLEAQREFMREGAKVLLRPAGKGQRCRIKNYGISYATATGERGLLAGQLYENFTAESLEEWALGLYGVEFRGEYPQCIVVSIDLKRENRAAVRCLRRSEVWPCDEDLEKFIKGDSEYPLNSRAVQKLFTFMERQSAAGQNSDGTEDLLLALFEQPSNTQPASVLATAGFEIEAAKELLPSLRVNRQKGTVSDVSWFGVFQRAQELARSFKSGETQSEHLLLAILQEPKSCARELLKTLKIDLEQLEDDLVRELRA
ncbi:MAG TPA: Clp protease N-terminal domain-containing protein [Trichormus sp.]|jgi:hypothetical protein